MYICIYWPVKHLHTCMYICKSVEILCLFVQRYACIYMYVSMFCREIADWLSDCGGLLHPGVLLWICATHHAWFPVERSLWYVNLNQVPNTTIYIHVHVIDFMCLCSVCTCRWRSGFRGLGETLGTDVKDSLWTVWSLLWRGKVCCMERKQGKSDSINCKEVIC